MHLNSQDITEYCYIALCYWKILLKFIFNRYKFKIDKTQFNRNIKGKREKQLKKKNRFLAF